jgi:hypothetical protein
MLLNLLPLLDPPKSLVTSFVFIYRVYPIILARLTRICLLIKPNVLDLLAMGQNNEGCVIYRTLSPIRNVKQEAGMLPY